MTDEDECVNLSDFHHDRSVSEGPYIITPTLDIQKTVKEFMKMLKAF